MSLDLFGLTALYSVSTDCNDGGRAAGVLTNDKISTQFVAYAKILPTDDANQIATNLHYAAQMHTRLIASMGISNQVCSTMWVGKETYKIEMILPNNKRYSAIVCDGDTDAVIIEKIDSAYAFINGTYSEKEKKQAAITALRALL